ncbi:benzoyl-CoA reductase [Desulfobulbus sp. Tol-SR]|jgi:benzoyl-CoA reductase/2-hydroxyglutaryl-CoA dehydratase subunit BcrC/BadD/HgdB|nr:benzoyl-CoA reductase [Desulfobulbus sp. Tol-SR]
MAITPLMNDGMDGAPAKRVLHSMQEQKEKGRRIVGIYCGYAPIELIQAMDLVPAVLCAFAEGPIASAETVLPANLCPLIKSSYGYILEGTCPFFGLSEAVVAETTCDGKKKMFELAAEVKPMHVMDLPQLPDEAEALVNWTAMIRKLQGFLEKTFDRRVSDDAIEASIKATNRKNRLMRRIFDYAALHPPLLCWQEMYDVGFLALPARGEEIEPLLESLLARLAVRREQGECFGTERSPRVLVTGCPVGGDALKIFRIIEEAGGLVVTPDSCTGIKSFLGETEEDTGDPVAAIARRYLAIPCACMTPNTRRLTALSQLIDRFRPDAVVDFVLTACHSYNVESHKIGRHVGERHGLPYLKIESNYSKSDEGQIRTKIEALFEIARS